MRYYFYSYTRFVCADMKLFLLENLQNSALKHPPNARAGAEQARSAGPFTRIRPAPLKFKASLHCARNPDHHHVSLCFR